MEPGFQGEISREELPQNAVMAALGRGGDARDSVTMFRDRIAIEEDEEEEDEEKEDEEEIQGDEDEGGK
ncbi:hypothetical protein BGZ92_005751, partial [Podila epicladia]